MNGFHMGARFSYETNAELFESYQAVMDKPAGKGLYFYNICVSYYYRMLRNFRCNVMYIFEISHRCTCSFTGAISIEVCTSHAVLSIPGRKMGGSSPDDSQAIMVGNNFTQTTVL